MRKKLRQATVPRGEAALTGTTLTEVTPAGAAAPADKKKETDCYKNIRE
ncbi:MAG: hypothetical protein GX876_02880 [Bacteroidales bacterium]|nr:hypothetical protein [Bacteroidales bacterium]